MEKFNVSPEDIISLSAKFQNEINYIEMQINDIFDINEQFCADEKEKYDGENCRKTMNDACATMSKFIDFAKNTAEEYIKCESDVCEAIDNII